MSVVGYSLAVGVTATPIITQGDHGETDGFSFMLQVPSTAGDGVYVGDENVQTVQGMGGIFVPPGESFSDQVVSDDVYYVRAPSGNVNCSVVLRGV